MTVTKRELLAALMAALVVAGIFSAFYLGKSSSVSTTPTTTATKATSTSVHYFICGENAVCSTTYTVSLNDTVTKP
jgi:hypothetical protein